MNESHLRSLVKAFSWRMFATLITIVISYAITHRISTAIYIGMFEFVSKIAIFYLHERVWAMIPFGLHKNNTEVITQRSVADIAL